MVAAVAAISSGVDALYCIFYTVLEPAHDLAVLVDTALKMASKYSFISNKLRFFRPFSPCLIYARRDREQVLRELLSIKSG